MNSTPAAWEDCGPCLVPESEGYAKEVEQIEHRIILTALNAAERMAGLPVTRPQVGECNAA